MLIFSKILKIVSSCCFVFLLFFTYSKPAIKQPKSMKFTECVDLTPEEGQFFLLCLHALVGRGDITSVEKIANKNPLLFKQYINKPMPESGKTLLMTALSTSCVKRVIIPIAVRDEFSEKDKSEFKTKKEKKAAMKKRSNELWDDKNLFGIKRREIKRNMVQCLVNNGLERSRDFSGCDASGRTCLFDAVNSRDIRLVVYILEQFC
jgi:hypothetical protein